MPSGKTHTRIDLGMLVVLMVAAAFFWNALCRFFGRDEMAEYGAIFVVAYLFGTFLLSPDMDLATSEPMHSWGVLRHLWRPYAHLFKHRGISHTPVVGTLTRVLYIVLLIYVISAVANVFLDLKWKMSLDELKRVDRFALAWALGGLCLPDLFHILADRIFKNAR